MKTEAVKTLLETDVDGYTLTIDKIVELDMDGNAVLSKLFAYVETPEGELGAFNYSPYAKLGEVVDSAKCWIACGCPELGNVLAPKWTKESLHKWVASQACNQRIICYNKKERKEI